MEWTEEKNNIFYPEWAWKHLRRRVKRSCWKKYNNEKSKLVVGLWKTSQNWVEILPLTETIDWIDINKETRNYFTGRVDEELG